MIVAISSQLRAMESKTIIKELGKVKVPVIPVQGKPFYPELDIDTRKKATLERIVEQYLNVCTSASLFVKKIKETISLPIATLSGHSDSVLSISFSPDGKTVVSGSLDNTTKLWDVANKKEITTLPGQGNAVNSAAFSPDGKRVACGSRDKTIRLWDVVDCEKEIATLSGHSDCVHSVAFSPDSKIVASASSDKTIKLWDVGFYIELEPFLKSLHADAKGIKKFFLLRKIFEHFEKTKEPLSLYQPEAIALLKELPAWLQKPLQEKQMVRVFKKVGNKA